MLHDDIEWPGFAVFILGPLDACFVIAGMGFASNVYKTSTEFIQVLLRRSGSFFRDEASIGESHRHLSRYCRRVARSLPCIKVRLGSTNYFDKTTPLIFTDFCISQLVNILLVSA